MYMSKGSLHHLVFSLGKTSDPEFESIKMQAEYNDLCIKVIFYCRTEGEPLDKIGKVCIITSQWPKQWLNCHQLLAWTCIACKRLMVSLK